MTGAGIAAAQDVSIDGIRFGQNGSTTRFVLDVSKEIQPRIFLLASPSRVVIDIPAAGWSATKTVKATGVVSGYRHGLFSADTYRIVLDLKSPVVVAKSFPLPARGGYSKRYVIDLKRTNQTTFMTAVKASRKQPSVQAVAPQPIPPRPRNAGGKRIIVVDAGHGGVDPGTLGKRGEQEKKITLNISKVIKRELEKTGRYKVYLTRDKDIYIKHRNRSGLARRTGADMFISVHVDAIKNTNVRGGTVYTLNEKASDEEAAWLAAKENKSDVLAGVDLSDTDNEVSNILIELAQRETMNSSARFAEMLVPEMRQQVRMHKRGHRFANFLVLKSPDVPSILLETGYITNRGDVKMLQSRDGPRRIANGLRRALDRYFETLVAEGR